MNPTIEEECRRFEELTNGDNGVDFFGGKGKVRQQFKSSLTKVWEEGRREMLSKIPEERIIHGYMEVQDEEKTIQYCVGWNDYRIKMIDLLSTLTKEK